MRLKLLARETQSWTFKVLFIAILLAFHNNRSSAFIQNQNNYIRFKQYSSKDGLSSDKVFNVLQDKYGIMWFATSDGLTRFDGTYFTVYRNEVGNDESLSCNFVLCLAEDHLGNLWIGTQNGLNYYNRTTNKFRRFYTSNKNTIPNNYIKALYFEENKTLWIETKGGFLCRYHYNSGSWLSKSHQGVDFEGDYYYHHIFRDSKKNVWIGGRETGIHLVQNSKRDYIQGALSNSKASGNEGSCFTETKDHRLITCDYAGVISEYNEKQNLFDSIAKIPIGATSAICDKKNNIWIAGNAGIAIVNLNTKKITLIRSISSDYYSLASNMVYCLYKDKDENIWIGTDKGISYFSNQFNQFRHYRFSSSQSNGLSSNDITALMQDRDGLIWVGTKENGVDTFSTQYELFNNLKYTLLDDNIDNKTFMREKAILSQYYLHTFIKSHLSSSYLFKSYSNYKNGIKSFEKVNENKVSTLYQDKKGKIYIGLWSHIGFNIYDKQTNCFKRYALWSKKPDNYFPILFEGELFGSNWYSGFLDDEKNRFWCATWEGVGLNQFDRDKGEFTGKHFITADVPRYPKSLIHSFAYDKNRKQLFMGGALYYGYYNYEENQFCRYGQLLPLNYPNKNILDQYNSCFRSIRYAKLPYDFRCYQITFDGDNIAWLSTENGILKHTLSSDIFRPVTHEKRCSKVSFKTALSNDKEILWVCKAKKLLARLNTRDNKITPFEKINKDYNRLLGKEIINTIYEDSQSILWIGTNSGLFKYNRTKNSLSRFNFKTNPLSQNANIITAITNIDKNKLCLAGTSGIWVLENGIEKDFYPVGSNKNNEIPCSYINQLFSYQDNEIWLGTDNGLICINLKKRTTLIYQHDELKKESLPNNKILAISKGEDNNLWVSTDAGLCILNRETEQFQNISLADKNNLSSRLTSCIFQDSRNRIWIGTTEKGLNVLNDDTEEITHFYSNSWDKNSLSDNNISCIFEDKNKTIWIGTQKGLNRFVESSQKFEKTTQLIERQILSIQEDHLDRLWIGTDKGLFCLGQTNGEYKLMGVLYSYHGLPSDELTGASCHLRDGRIAVGSRNGFVIFPADSINFNVKAPKTIFSFLTIRDSIRIFDLSAKRIIELPYNDNSFSVRFSAIEYQFNSALKYRFRLIGFEKTWNYTDAQHTIIKYTNIPSGSYLLEVEVTNRYGIWTGVVNCLKIEIKTPWYKQWWFYSILLIVMILIVLFTIKIRENSIRQTNKQLEETVNKRTAELIETKENLIKTLNITNKFFGIISHDLKNPIHGISYSLGLLVNNYDNLDNTKKLKLLTTINQSVENTKMLLGNLLNWALNEQNLLGTNMTSINLQASANEALVVIEPYAKEKNITIKNTIPSDLKVIADQNILTSVFQNLISNAVKFSNQKSIVTISAISVGEITTVTVSDYGIGINEKRLQNLFRIDTKFTTRGTQNEQGTGLGLIIVKEFVSKLGGEIKVQSIEGKGTTVSFTLKTAEIND